MNIKAILVAASALVLSASAVSAQNNKGQRGSAAKDSTCMVKKGGCAKQAPCLFDNLNLTDAQKAKIQALKENQRKMKDAQKKERGERKEAAQAERNNARKDYLANLKTILTPEQYVQFLENNYLAAGRHSGKDMKDMRHHDRRGEKDMKHGMKGDRKGAPRAKADKK
ncbi:MAG: hypothetical protein K2M11_00295 [Paramuribaculum sp.]|nr:hypothetical protein [Paramuribaculum sp.]